MIARLLCIVCLLGAALPASAQDSATTDTHALGTPGDVEARQAVRVELDVQPEEAFVHQVVTMRVRLLIEPSFLAERLVPLFRRALDLPVQLAAESARIPAGTRSAPDVEDAAEVPPGVTLALGDTVVHAVRAPDAVRDGRTFAVFVLERRFSADAPGVLDIPAARLRVRHATRFADDLLRGRVPEDARTLEIASPARSCRVLPFPEADRPAGFAGAVGRFTLHAELSASRVVAGRSVRLLLRIDAGDDTDVSRFPAPELERALGDFTVLGRLDAQDGNTRTLQYDLAPRATGALVVPALAFPVLDPGPPARYRELSTPALTLDVVPDGDGAASGRVGDGAHRDAPAWRPVRAGRHAPRHPSAALAVGTALGPWLAAFGLAAWRRARERVRRDPEGMRARAAAASFAAHVARAGDEWPDAWIEYLAARLRCSRAAVVTPHLDARLRDAGVPSDVAADALRIVDAAVAARYGGRAPDDATSARDRATSVVARLEAAFRAAENAA